MPLPRENMIEQLTPIGESATPHHEPPLIVDVAACQRLGRLLAARTIPKDEEESTLAGFSREEIGNFYLLLVAICHQTSPRGRPPLEGTVNGVHLRGWDYLSAKLEAAARSNRELLGPTRWHGTNCAGLCRAVPRSCSR